MEWRIEGDDLHAAYKFGRRSAAAVHDLALSAQTTAMESGNVVCAIAAGPH